MESSEAHRRGENTSSSGSASHLLYVLQRTKEDLEKDMKAGFEALTKIVQDLSQKVDVESRTVRQILQTVSERGSVLECEEVKPLDINPQHKSASELKLLKKVAHKEMAMTCVLQWLCLATVVSFTKSNGAVRSWVQPNVYDRLKDHMSAISGASGLSCLFFAVTNKDGKDKYQSDIGKLWTFIIRSAIVSIVLQVKQILSAPQLETAVHDGQNSERNLPEWLSSFGNSRKIVGFVNVFMDKAEYKAAISSSECSGEGERSARKKRRLERDDEFAETRRSALQLLRKSIMRWVTIGRTELRAHLFGKILFVIEKIETFDSVEAARTEGFEIVFQNVSENEAISSANEVGSAWNIQNAKVRNRKESSEKPSTAGDSLVFQENEKQLSALQERFPSLTVTLKYKRKVEKDARQMPSERRTGDTLDEQILWPVEERINLHKIATGCLMEAFGCKDANMVLSCSPYSVKAIHVLSVGIRGLLKQCLGLELSAVESSALGRVTHKRVQKGDAKASTMLGNDESTRRKKDIRMQKLSMSWSEYTVQRTRMEEEEQRRREERISGSDGSAEDDLGDELDWMNFAGGEEM